MEFHSGVLGTAVIRRKGRRITVTSALIALAFSLGPPLANAATEPAATTRRLAGPTRYDTAVAISRDTFPTGASEIVLARGDKFPDALVGSYVVSLYYDIGGPVLLTQPEQMPLVVKEELARLGPSRVWIIGDQAAVSAGIEAEVRGMGNDVRRLAGPTRYDNPYLAATKTDARTTSFVVSGETFADAVAVGPLASRSSVPIVLTMQNALPQGARDALRQQDTSRVLIVGGTSAVSESVAEEIRAMRDSSGQQLQVTRIAGTTRQQTATLVADLSMNSELFDFSVRHVNLVRGDAFPDAVAAGPHGGEEEAVTLMTTSATELGESARRWLESNAGRIDSIHALGDTGVISDAVLAAAAQAAGG